MTEEISNIAYAIGFFFIVAGIVGIFEMISKIKSGAIHISAREPTQKNKNPILFWTYLITSLVMLLTAIFIGLVIIYPILSRIMHLAGIG